MTQIWSGGVGRGGTRVLSGGVRKAMFRLTHSSQLLEPKLLLPSRPSAGLLSATRSHAQVLVFVLPSQSQQQGPVLGRLSHAPIYNQPEKPLFLNGLGFV